MRSDPYRSPAAFACGCLMAVVLAGATVALAQESPQDKLESETEESTTADRSAAQSPALQARNHSSAGDRLVAQGEKLEKKVAGERDATRRDELTQRVRTSYESAIHEYTAALKLDPTLTSAYVGLGSLLTKAGRFDQAIATFDQALKESPGDEDALLGRGRAQLAGFKVLDAQATYDELAPRDSKKARQLLGEMRAWLEARRPKLGPDMAQAVADFDTWLGEREKGRSH